MQNLKKESLKIQKKTVDNHVDAALNYNAHLERENATLRTQVQDLTEKYEGLWKYFQEKREKFRSDFERLHQEVKINEGHLIDKNKKYLEQQKKLTEEVKRMKRENEELKLQRQNIENVTTKEINKLESEITLLKRDQEILRAGYQRSNEKYQKNKIKLQHAMSVIQELTEVVSHYATKPKNVCEITQTEWETFETNPSDCSQPRDSVLKNAENLLLSDIFFKPRSFCDSEIDLFRVRSKTKCLSKTLR
ncbi:hypothetical protein ABEB36_004181 [Hypothenemus hampei]|uniref:Cilia- and flagella-associated protein 157 n=1 Tax=Hypothenemus hampei TaxID=57062 RepID=A0ABD1F2H7_HYPHA